MLFLFDGGITDNRFGNGGTVDSPFAFGVGSCKADPFVVYVDGGVVLPYVEFNVEEDFAVGTVLLDSLEESLV